MVLSGIIYNIVVVGSQQATDNQVTTVLLKAGQI